MFFKNSNKRQGYLAAGLLMCVLSSLFYCYEYFLRVAPSVMQAELMRSYQLSPAGLGRLIAYYYFAYVPLQIPVGILLDRYGPHKILTLACACCAFGTYIFSSTNILLLARVGRFLVGFGSAFAYVGVLKIANMWLPRRYFAMVAGICTALGMFGAMSGEIVMAKLVEINGWRAAMSGSALIGVLLTVAIWWVIQDKSNKKQYPIYTTFELLQEIFKIIKSPQLLYAGFIGLCMFLPLTIFAEFWAVPFYEALGYSKANAALASGIVFFGVGVGGPFWGRVSDIVQSRRKPMLIGSLGGSLCAIPILLLNPLPYFLSLLLLFSLGFFISAQVLIFAIGNDLSRPSVSSTTVACLNFMVMLGGFIVQPLVGWLLEVIMHYNYNATSIAQVNDFSQALALMPAALMLSTLIVKYLLKESYWSGD